MAGAVGVLGAELLARATWVDDLFVLVLKKTDDRVRAVEARVNRLEEYTRQLEQRMDRVELRETARTD